jgi:hypothetical protein
MNFTYLIDGPREPAQELLQTYECFAVIVTLSDKMSEFVIENAGFEIRSDKNVLCWLIQPKHFITAPKDSTLHRLHEFLMSNNYFGNIEHSFLAFASRNDLITNSGGHYIPLHLHLEDDNKRRREIIKSAIKEMLSASRPLEKIPKIDTLISAASFIATLIGLAK